jgi:hypothetical protein
MRPVRAIQLLLLSFALFACTRPAVEPAPVAKVPAAADVAGASCRTTDETPALADLTPVGQQCGSIVCRPGLHCCNASCGICRPPGVECTQQACFAPSSAALTQRSGRI